VHWNEQIDCVGSAVESRRHKDRRWITAGSGGAGSIHGRKETVVVKGESIESCKDGLVHKV
jgi:hypothetical protein